MNITNHAVERYAQRVMGKSNSVISDISAAEAENIRGILEKKVNPGNLLYKNMPYQDRNGANVDTDIYLDSDVVLAVDPKTDTIVTIFRIDLGFDDALNARYINALRSKIDALSKIKDIQVNNYKEIVKNYNEYINDYNKSIQEAEKRIDEYKRAVKQYEQQREEAQNEMNVIIKGADAEIQALVSTMIQKK